MSDSPRPFRLLTFQKRRQDAAPPQSFLLMRLQYKIQELEKVRPGAVEVFDQLAGDMLLEWGDR